MLHWRTMRTAIGWACTVAVVACGTEPAKPAQSGSDAVGSDTDAAVDAGTPTDATAGCGPAALDCGGAACVEGACAPVSVAEGQPFPCRIEADADGVFWLVQPFDGKQGAVVRRAGTEAPVRLAEVPGAPMALVLDATHVYFSTSGPPAVLYRVPRAGGSLETIASDADPSNGNLVRSLALDAADLWWSDYKTSQVVRVAKGAKNPEVFAKPIAPSDIARIDASVLVVSQGARALLEYPVAGGDPVARADWTCDKIMACTGGAGLVGRSYLVALTAKDEAAGRVLAYDLDTQAVAVVATGQKSPIGVAALGDRAFWLNAGTSNAGFLDGEIRTALRDGSQAATVATGLREACGIAAWGGFVYYTSKVEGRVYRINVGP
ncbi:MAG: hypothetical protein ACOYOB_18110 [Myxococcota bacterium]